MTVMQIKNTNPTIFYVLHSRIFFVKEKFILG